MFSWFLKTSIISGCHQSVVVERSREGGKEEQTSL